MESKPRESGLTIQNWIVDGFKQVGPKALNLSKNIVRFITICFWGHNIIIFIYQTKLDGQKNGWMDENKINLSSS